MTKSISDELFFAWLDGELEGDEAAKVAAKVAADPELQAQADQHRAMQATLRSAFGPIMDAPVPDRIGDAPLDFAAARAARDERVERARPKLLPQWAAIAATLVLGVGLGSTLSLRQAPASDSLVASQGGRMVAAAALDQALDKQLASAQATGTGPRVGLTFRANDGKLCRSFSQAAGSSGLACRNGDDWEVRGLFSGSATGGDYRMAAGEDPRLAALIDSEIAGDPLDAAGEAAAQQKGWR